MNTIPHEERLLNLYALLAEHDPVNDYVSLPSNNDAARVLSSQSNVTSTPSTEDDNMMEVGNYYVTLITEGNVDTWYIASYEGQNSQNTNGRYTMDHLTRVQQGSDLKWKHPVKTDIINLKPELIVKCVIDGEWDVSHERNMTYTLRNHTFISKTIEQFLK